MAVNAQGLLRNIPESIKREVRQRCQFGCIICGKAIFQYEHFEPEFRDAKEHNADGITLLCAGHHDEKTRGFISNDQIRSYNERPYCVRNGNAFGQMNCTNEMPRILLGDSIFENCKIFLRIGREKVFWVRKSRDDGEGFLLNARVRDNLGNVIFEIIDNEWCVGFGQWDVVTTGTAIKIRSRSNKVSLLVRILPPSDLKIEGMDLWHRGRRFKVSKHGEMIIDGSATFSRFSCRNLLVGIQVGYDGSIGFGVNNIAPDIMYSKLLSTTNLTPIFARSQSLKIGAGNGN